MDEFFKFSQQVKDNILEGSLVSIVRDLLSREKIFRPARSGTRNHFYRIGQLENGLWVAARQLQIHRTLGDHLVHLAVYEDYAQKAEYHAQNLGEGERITRFCVGVVGFDDACLLVEDYEEGGKRELIIKPGDVMGHFKDNPKERLYVDLGDPQGQMEEEELRFFSKEARINF